MATDYTQTPLFKKLELKPDIEADIIDAPDELFDLLYGMPEDIVWDDASNELDFLLSFHPDRAQFEEQMDGCRNRLKPSGKWWVATRKGQPKSPNRLSGNEVREILRPLGFKDVKVCSINDEWSAVKYMAQK